MNISVMIAYVGGIIILHSQTRWGHNSQPYNQLCSMKKVNWIHRTDIESCIGVGDAKVKAGGGWGVVQGKLHSSWKLITQIRSSFWWVWTRYIIQELMDNSKLLLGLQEEEEKRGRIIVRRHLNPQLHQRHLTIHYNLDRTIHEGMNSWVRKVLRT